MIIDNNLNIQSSDPFSDDFNLGSPPESLPDYASDTRNTRHGTSQRSHTLPNLPSSSRIPSMPPPVYSVPRPARPQIYTFTSWASDTTLLLPPPTAQNRSPLYRISTSLNLNPFAPLSYITTIRRGGDVDGDMVSEFELALSHTRAMVSVGNSCLRMSSILTNFGGSAPPRTIWRWKHGQIDFRWDCRSTLNDGSPMCICMDANKLQLASFIPPPLDAAPPPPEATLTVFPDGHQYFDDVLLSALVIARKITLSF